MLSHERMAVARALAEAETPLSLTRIEDSQRRGGADGVLRDVWTRLGPLPWARAPDHGGRLWSEVHVASSAAARRRFLGRGVAHQSKLVRIWRPRSLAIFAIFDIVLAPT